MTVVTDPKGVSAQVIQQFYDFTNKGVLEIGCGRGRMTFPLAGPSLHITAIDPLEEDIQTAIENTPPDLREKIDFIVSGIEHFDPPPGGAKFDIAIFTWSL
jgi:2-polyprenyl-3-methyl-5-hydroxy-6-metoxy-1,4-benzoquinol methylase